MKKFIILIALAVAIPAFGGDYGVYGPQNYQYNQDEGEMTLFILDFSNSMSEYLEGQSKAQMMVETVRNLLPSINRNNKVGLRVYGHKMGFTPFDACRASSLLVPIGKMDNFAINQALSETKPRGMTPITYSLKQAIKYDFMGFSGKKHIILLTDGGENCDESPCDYAMELIKTRDDISIDVIAFNITDPEANNQLKCAALATYGKFYTANTAAELMKSLSNSLGVSKEVQGVIITH